MRLLLLLAFAALLLSACDSAEDPEDFYAQHVEIVQEAYSTYDSLLTTMEPEEARPLLVTSLEGREGVNDPFLAEDRVSVCWQTPLEYYHCFITETRFSIYRDEEGGAASAAVDSSSFSEAAVTRTDHRNGQSRALVLSPYRWQAIPFTEPIANAASYTSRILENTGFYVEYKSNEDSEDENVLISDFSSFDQFDIVHIVTHGGYYRGITFLATGEFETSERVEQYREDMRNGRIITVTHYEPLLEPYGIGETVRTFALTSRWFNNQYPLKLDGMCIVADVCHATEGTDLTNALVGNGSVFFGWDNQVGTLHATAASKELITHLAANGLSAGEAHTRLREDGHDVGCQLNFPLALCPSSLQTRFRLIGNSAFRLPNAPLRIAATPPYWDDIGALLEGFGHEVADIGLGALDEIGTLSQFDIVAINCSPDVDTPTAAEIAALRAFVDAGGKLYVSDHAFPYVASTFPDAIDFADEPYGGSVQPINAEVTYDDLASYLGTTSVVVDFDLPSWVLVDGPGLGTTVLLEGNVVESLHASGRPPVERHRQNVESMFGRSTSALRPLALSFTYGAGEVVFTSFHNEEQLSNEVRFILEYFTVL